MNRRADSAQGRQAGPLPAAFSSLFGAFLGLALIKFGNPPIMEKWVTAPTTTYEFFLGSPWPITWAYGLLTVVALAGALVVSPRRHAPHWIVLLPLLWFIWECVASFWTVNPELTKPTLAHFFACTACFYLGFFSLAGERRVALFWPGLICGFVLVIAVGWQQQFGGLEQTRQYFFLYILPRMKEVPPEYLKKIESARIFSTLFYPNALAGVMLLLLPVVLPLIWCARERFTPGARAFLVSLLATGGLACLFWSGSKGGWLLMLLLGLTWLLGLPFSTALKRVAVLIVLIAGLAGFFWKYAAFFQKGATSVSARFDYWNAALKTVAAHPLSGTGPGTFSIAYQEVKRPESEMARLAHNDYLQQGSDSGLPGLILYTAFIGGVLACSRPQFRPGIPGVPSGKTLPGPEGQPCSWVRSLSRAVGTALAIGEEPIWFGLWLGTLGWALQSVLEFGLYIPALAWPAFAFMGLLLAKRYSC